MAEPVDIDNLPNAKLAEVLRATMNRITTLIQTASQKFKESEADAWNDDIYQEAQKLIAEAEALSQEMTHISDELERRMGPEVVTEILEHQRPRRGDTGQRWYRKDLTTRTVPVTGNIDDTLEGGLEALLTRVPKSWWREQQSRIDKEQQEAILHPLILCGRERWGTGYPKLQKYASYLATAKDYILKSEFLDIFAASRAIPTICALGMSLDSLNDVKGASKKLRELCSAPNSEVDSRIYELLVAAAVTRYGYGVEFIEPSVSKSPDLRVHGLPFPAVIECKRRQVLNQYELAEFEVIRQLFHQLLIQRERLGLIGELSIDFRCEITTLNVDEIVQSIQGIARSLSPYGTMDASWGTFSFSPVSVSQQFEMTRLYGPNFLEKLSCIDLEVDEFDGIFVYVKNCQSPITDRAELPFTMKWSSNSEVALDKKLQTIKNLWMEAVDQIPTGEGGLIYLAYEEGHRPSLADARTDAIRELVSKIYFKRRAISIPMTVVTRLLLNTLADGRPDLIENAVPLVDGDRESYDLWTSDFPTLVYSCM